MRQILGHPDRIKILAAGLQEVVTSSEEYCENLKTSVEQLQHKVNYLSQFSNKIDAWLDEEKKSNSIIEK